MTIRQIGKTTLLRGPKKAFHHTACDVLFVRHPARRSAEFFASQLDEFGKIAFPNSLLATESPSRICSNQWVTEPSDDISDLSPRPKTTTCLAYAPLPASQAIHADSRFWWPLTRAMIRRIGDRTELGRPSRKVILSLDVSSLFFGFV